MVEMVPTKINDRWTLLLPEHRAARPEWAWWELPRLASMHANLRPGDVIVDVGAEEGDISALLAKWSFGIEPGDSYEERDEDGRLMVSRKDTDRLISGVILVEPNPKVWPNIKAIWEANHLPDPLATFVGFCGPRPYLPHGIDGLRIDDGWPVCADGEIIGNHGFLNLCERNDVPRTTLDIIGLEQRIDAVTIDVEGAELEVLFGAQGLMLEQKPMFWVSVHPDFMRDMYGQTRQELLDWMTLHGYRSEHLAAEHEHHILFWHPDGRIPVLPYGGPT